MPIVISKKIPSQEYDKCVRMERELAVNYSLKSNYVLYLNRSVKSEVTFSRMLIE